MKPLKLTLQAFGPYAESETIDFTTLENRTMFVVSGKTGSGKTTIFDGISYAIYGKASGEDRNGPDLRSQFARDELLTEVSLDFSLRNKTYRITRSPQQEKKKERGDGFTTVGAKAELYLLNDGSSQLLAANVRDVDEKIKEIMIIDSNQFRQILMIPQGEFRKLLTSDSKDKEVILQRLFHTEIYKRIEERLKVEATELKKLVEAQADERNSALKKVHAFGNEELQTYLESGNMNDALMVPLIKAGIAAMEEELESLNVGRNRLQHQRDQLQQKLFEAETIIKQMKALEELTQKKAALEQQKEYFNEKEREARLANKAALLASQEELCHRLKQDSDQLQARISVMSDRIEALKQKQILCEEELNRQTGREQERKEAADAINHLEHIKEDVKAYAGLQMETGKLHQYLENVKRQKQLYDTETIKLEENLKNLHSEKEEIEKVQFQSVEVERNLEKLQAELDKLSKYRSQLGRIKQASDHFEKKKALYEKAEERLQDGKALVRELEQTWLHSQAAVLASTLTADEACPVCGSEHHPKPASGNEGQFPTQEDLKIAREQAGQLEKEKGKADKDYIESSTSLKALRETGRELLDELQNIRPGFEEEQLDAAIDSVKGDQNRLLELQAALAAKVKRLGHVKEEITKADLKRISHLEKIKKLEEDFQNITIQYTEKKTTLSRMTDSIPENLRSWDAFEQQLQFARRRVDKLAEELEKAQKLYQDAKELLDAENTRVEEADKRMKEIKDKLAEERESFRASMIHQGFENYPQYNQAKRTDAEIEDLENSVSRYREELRSVSDREEEYSRILKDIQKPDLVSLKSSLADLDTKLSQLTEEYQNIYIQKRENENIISTVERINESIKTLEERYLLIGHLYEVSKGQNTHRITFERYVLGAFLDDILREANGRLAKMTSGRYRLLRKTDRSKGNAQSGLELLVFDQYTGQERHVKTLSGGESFKAALSLALGLADVVQSYAGGVSLETMFIDEGFGTLDPESLDQAIETLIDIQSSGRLVGIISHVPELKERIDVRLEVTATQSGSKTKFHFLNS
ncbi:AAA family ATPase [Mesobacillus foraminis]|uniref:Nuclease SbcCD subunit C n=1 Tax=Mesobacillus foraminis TaxID=279826 RepID=A0A4V2RE55_9BACI|nr:SMC family ATPase [Mesobacillus foraminis]TCN27400.1 exonuclease SbcC [Mesobacillus foraminis]